jgi:hypothetical protein
VLLAFGRESSGCATQRESGSPAFGRRLRTFSPLPGRNCGWHRPIPPSLCGFVSAANAFAGLAAHHAEVFTDRGARRHGGGACSRITNVRLLGSDCGLGEIALPEDAPGSSIMPREVNPTQAEALAVACWQYSAFRPSSSPSSLAEPRSCPRSAMAGRLRLLNRPMPTPPLEAGAARPYDLLEFDHLVQPDTTHIPLNRLEGAGNYSHYGCINEPPIYVQSPTFVHR